MSQMQSKYIKANQSKRFVAYVIDWFIGSLVIMLPVSLYYLAMTKDIENVSNVNITTIYANYGTTAAVVIGIISLIGGLGYYVAVPYLNNGQTIGKRIFELKVVNQDESNVDLKTMVIRQVLVLMLLETYLFSTSHLFIYLLEIITNFEFIKYYYSIGIFVSAVSCILVAFGHQHYAIHDLVSKTKVVGIVSETKDQRI